MQASGPSREGVLAAPPGTAGEKPGPSLAPLLLAPALILFLGVFIVPLLGVLFESVGRTDFTVQHYVKVFNDAVLMKVLVRTIVLSLVVTAICLLLGYPIAYVMLQSSGWMQRLIALLIVLPLWTSLLVRTYAWMVILGRKGLVNETLIGLGAIDAPLTLLYTRFSVYVGMVHIMLPFMVLPLFAVMRRIDTSLLSGAWSLGASRPMAFFFVFLPLSMPGILAGSLLVFILSIGFFVTPALLGGLGDTTFVMLIERQVNRLGNWPLAAAMSVILLVATLVLVIVYNRVLSSKVGGSALSTAVWVRLVSVAALGSFLVERIADVLAQAVPRSLRGPPRQRPPSTFPFAGIVAWATILLMIFPIVILYPLSFSDAPYLQFPPTEYSTRWYENYFARNDWIRPTIISFEVGFIVMVLGTAIGTAAAVALVRGVVSREEGGPGPSSLADHRSDHHLRRRALLPVRDLRPRGDTHGPRARAPHPRGPLRHRGRRLGPRAGGPRAGAGRVDARRDQVHDLPQGHAAPDTPRRDHRRALRVPRVLRRGGDRHLSQRGADQDPAETDVGRDPRGESIRPRPPWRPCW